MNIIMLGAPGSGKGTLGKVLIEKYNLTNLSTGDIFRSEIKNKTELGVKANEYISKGKLVPDEITIQMVEKILDKSDNVLFDGYPRTLKQGEALTEYCKKNNKKINVVINLVVPDKDIIVRTSSRLICPKDGSIYNKVFSKPKVEGKCDLCGEELITREDDTVETISNRLKVYHENTEPLIDYYKGMNLLESIEMDIYSKTLTEDSNKRAFEIIESHKD